MWYAYGVICLWVLVPCLRRLIDWKVGFNSVNVVSVVPLMSMLPAAWMVLRRADRVPPIARTAAWLWCGGFGYAFLVSGLMNNIPAATYALLNFILPMCFGLYVVTLGLPVEELYRRFASFGLRLSVPLALYAIYQYVYPPAWDVLWIQQADIPSVGSAVPFGFKPFATLNGPGVYADFLAGIILLNLGRLRGADYKRVAAVMLNVVVLALTLVRSDWIALLIGAIAFVALSPKKFQNLSFIAFISLVVVVFVGNAGTLFGDSRIGDNLLGRFASLGSLETDTSYRERQTYFGDVLAAAATAPMGQGLGVTGTAAKLGAAGANVAFDNGYVARFTEMGYFGFATYLATLGLTLVVAIRCWRTSSRFGDAALASIVAVAVAMQVALLFQDVSSDHHSQLAGIFYWLSFALVCRPVPASSRAA